MTTPARLDDLPLRMTAAEVCALARCSAVTLWRRRRADPTWLPAAAHQLSRELIFERAAVFKALGFDHDDRPQEPAAGWKVDPDAIREARARQVRQPARAKGGRDVARAVRGAAARWRSEDVRATWGPATVVSPL